MIAFDSGQRALAGKYSDETLLVLAHDHAAADARSAMNVSQGPNYGLTARRLAASEISR
jgi:hypothetical protein